MLKHGTPGRDKKKIPSRPVPAVPCFQRENTGQPGRDNPMSRPDCVSENKGHWIVPSVPCFLVENTGQSRPGCVSVNTGHWFVPSRLSRVFSLKTRGSPVCKYGALDCLDLLAFSLSWPAVCVVFIFYCFPFPFCVQGRVW